MPNATLTICTIVDGKETLFSPKGTLTDYGKKIVIDYLDGEAETQITVQNGEAKVLRKGDYGTFLSLVTGKKTQGELTILGSVGKIELFTYLAEYSKKSNKYLITLRYDIFFNGETQKMQVRILAKNEG